LLPWAWRAGDINRLLHGVQQQWRRSSTAHSSTAVSIEGEQCYVSSRRIRLNTDLFADKMHQKSFRGWAELHCMPVRNMNPPSEFTVFPGENEGWG